MILNAKYRVIRKEKQNLIFEPMVNKFDILCDNNLDESEKQQDNIFLKESNIAKFANTQNIKIGKKNETK